MSRSDKGTYMNAIYVTEFLKTVSVICLHFTSLVPWRQDGA